MAAAVVDKDAKDFDSTYKEALSHMSFISKDKVYRNGGEKTQEAPAIEFLGLFDTVKYAKEPVKFDISFEPKCFKRVRHALSLNEDRPQFVPEIYRTSPNERLPDNSLVQAWFLGSHADIGGGHEHDGLSLYPLQWMLLESRKHGLILEHKPQKRFEKLIDDPLKLVLPQTIPSAAEGDETAQEANEIQPWRYRYSNGIEVDMILICGNAGVGKSTLLNRPFETDKHPGLILHDSEGFQAGDTKEVVAFEKFLKKRLMAPDVEDQLHAIWICVESYTERPIHTAEETILSYIEDLAPDMPVIIVGTKTDKFLKFENIADDPKTQQDTLNNQVEAFRRLYEQKVKKVQLKFVFVSQGK
ncbi:hypothetical protein INS49_010579 [Diaporthe citri]|uniref:uncharacterized protein n=1 Tax=Diaporthe citri TaxID=83186 RepID=UPI001C80FF27|nr:uncharacterized protein INS49_010579 [Diaporthe citri]KAG6362349.1 hypothetical protein INS49_010579 [Diaporthe citri]